jgi:hypothetical protein
LVQNIKVQPCEGFCGAPTALKPNPRRDCPEPVEGLLHQKLTTKVNLHLEHKHKQGLIPGNRP